MKNLIHMGVGMILPNHIGLEDGPQVDVNNGIDIVVHLSEPNEREINAFKAEHTQIQMKLAVEKDIIFFLMKFGAMPWMDAPYNVHLGSELDGLPWIEEGQGMTARVYLVDTATGKIEAIRLLGLSTNISKLLIKSIKEQQSMPFNLNSYIANVQEVYAKKTTEHLVKEGIGHCVLS